MKRLIAAVLSLLLGAVPAAATAEEEYVPIERLMWDIPFGISVEEYEVLLKERTDIELTKNEIDPSFISYRSPEYELGIYGHPASLLLDFGDDGKLCAIMAEETVPIPPKGWESFTAKLLQLTLEMINKAEQDYGEALGGTVSFDFDMLEKYSLPIVNGEPDQNTINYMFTDDFQYFALHYFLNPICRM